MIICGGLVHAYLSRLGLPAKRLGDPEHTISSYALDDILAARSDELDLVTVLLDTDERRCGELVDYATSLAIQVQCDSVAGLVGLLAVSQNGSVVATNLSRASSFRCRTVKVLKDKSIYGVGSVVDAGGNAVNNKSVLLGRIEAQLC